MNEGESPSKAQSSEEGSKPGVKSDASETGREQLTEIDQLVSDDNREGPSKARLLAQDSKPDVKVDAPETEGKTPNQNRSPSVFFNGVSPSKPGPSRAYFLEDES